MAKDKKGSKASAAAQDEKEVGIPKEVREFTTREKGGHVVYLQKLTMAEAFGKTAPRVLKRAITVRLQKGVKFDPFVECGPEGKSRAFRDISSEDAFEALKAKAAERESPVVLWDDRPMSDEESAHSKELKAANKRADEQEAANAKLLEIIEENGLKVPEGM